MNPLLVCVAPKHFQLRESPASGPCPGMMDGVCQIEAKDAMASIVDNSYLSMMSKPLGFEEKTIHESTLCGL